MHGATHKVHWATDRYVICRGPRIVAPRRV